MKTRSRDTGLFGYHEPPQVPNLCRDVYKWVQSLDLTFALKAPRRDCANGFLVAEILSRYFPADFSMRGYSNGKSTATRTDNWAQVQRACRKHGFQLPADVVAATSEERCGAAVALLEQLYEHLTQKQIRRPEELPEAVSASPEATRKPADAQKPSDGQFAGVYGAAAISAAAAPRGDLQFGNVSTRNIADAAALRQQLSAT